MRALTLALVAFLAACEQSAVPEPEVPVGLFPEPFVPAALPVLLTGEGVGAMEAISAGTLRRSGDCLYLDPSVEDGLIVWGDDTVIEAELDGWVVRFPSGLEAREGDFIQGGGGGLPTGRPISDFTEQPVPEACSMGGAVQVHSVEAVRSLTQPDEELPDPPPPPPAAPDFLQTVRESGAAEQGEAAIVDAVDPREALFLHVVSSVRGIGSSNRRPACLRQADPVLLLKIQSRYADVYPAPMCRWENGGVVLRADDTPAVFVDARLNCDGRSLCAGEGAVTYGNVGGEGFGYIMRPVRGGWMIRKMGLSWMS